MRSFFKARERSPRTQINDNDAIPERSSNFFSFWVVRYTFFPPLADVIVDTLDLLVLFHVLASSNG